MQRRIKWASDYDDAYIGIYKMAAFVSGDCPAFSWR